MPHSHKKKMRAPRDKRFMRWGYQLAPFWALICVGSFIFGNGFALVDVALLPLGETSVTRTALAITFFVWLICYFVLQLAQFTLDTDSGGLTLPFGAWGPFRPWGLIEDTNIVGRFCARASMFLSVVNVIAVGLFCVLGSGELPYFDISSWYKLIALFLLFISAWCSGASYLGFAAADWNAAGHSTEFPWRIIVCKWIGMTAFCACFLLIGISGVVNGAYSSLK